MASRYCYKDVLPFAAMVAAECSNVCLNTIYKAASLKGMNCYVFYFYSSLLNTLVLMAFSFFCRNMTLLPLFQFPLLIRICILVITGCLGDMAGYKGIDYSSPTLASAMSNLTPAFTFILAVIFRMEKLSLRSSSSISKIIGTLVSISGALVVVLYKGQTILSASPQTSAVSLDEPLSSTQSNWVIGGLLLALQFLLCSIWYIIQTQVLQIYPSAVTVLFFYKLYTTIILAPVCFIAEPNWSVWRLRPDIALAATVYSGLLGTPFIAVIHSWGLHLKGPVYVTTFRPVSIAIAAAAAVIFLGDALHLGSVLGAIVISIGVFAVISGKKKEEEISEECDCSSLEPSSIGTNTVPLLHSHKV